jgi:hypothetical protein
LFCSPVPIFLPALPSADYSIRSRLGPIFFSSEAALREWWTILAAARPADEHGVANLALRMAGYHLQNWSKVQPQACLAILTEAETRYWAASSAGEQADWKWWVARFAEMLQGAAGRVPEAERAEFLAAVERLVNQSDTDETLPLHTRTFTLTNQARQLYSQGQTEAAAALLDGWWAKYGDQIRTPDFYAVRFFVAYLGQGDRATATRMVERAGRLAATDAVFAKDGNYTGMMDAYYARLAWSEDELKRQAQLFVAARRRLAGRDGGQGQ